MNAMIYTKPGREEMDGLWYIGTLIQPYSYTTISTIALETLGNPGWNWESYQRYVKRAERMCAPEVGIPDQEYRDLYNPDSVGHDGMCLLLCKRCRSDLRF